MYKEVDAMKRKTVILALAAAMLLGGCGSSIAAASGCVRSDGADNRGERGRFRSNIRDDRWPGGAGADPGSLSEKR